MQISHTFSLSRHLLWSKVSDVEKTSSEGKGRGSTWLHKRASGSCRSGKYLSQARCPERKRNIRGAQPESRSHIYANLLSLLFNCCPWSATDQIISIQMLGRSRHTLLGVKQFFITDAKQFTTFRMSLPVCLIENGNLTQKLMFVSTPIFFPNLRLSGEMWKTSWVREFLISLPCCCRS